MTVDSISQFHCFAKMYDGGVCVYAEDYWPMSYLSVIAASVSESVTVDLSNLGVLPVNVMQWKGGVVDTGTTGKPSVNIVEIDAFTTNDGSAVLQLSDFTVYKTSGTAVSFSSGDGIGFYTSGAIAGTKMWGSNTDGIGLLAVGSTGGATKIGIQSGNSGTSRIAGYLDRLGAAGLASDTQWIDTRTEIFSHPTAAEIWNLAYSTGFTAGSMGDSAKSWWNTNYYLGRSRTGVWGADSGTYATPAGTMGKAASATAAAAGGITEAQMHTMLDTQTVFTAVADLWPTLQGVDTVDAAGTNTRTQFVIDSAAFGYNNPMGLVNQKIIIRQDSLKPMAVGVSEVSVTGGNYTITVTDSMQVAFSPGDSIWFASDIANTYATLPETAKETADTTLGRDTTIYTGSSATIGGSIVSGGTGTDSDTTAMKTMLENNRILALFDSLLLVTKRSELATITQAGLDSLRATAKRLNDSLSSQEWATSGGSGDDPAGVRFVVRVWDGTNLAAVPNAEVTWRTSLIGTVYDHRKTANSLGNATVDIDTGWYYIFVEATGLNFPDSLRHITGADSILISGTGVVLVPPSSPSLCRFVMLLTTDPYAGAEAKFTLLNASGDIPVDSSSNAAIKTVLYGSADASGVLQKDLNRNSFIYLLRSRQFNTTEWEYRIKMRGSGPWETAPIVGKIKIPSDSTYFRPQGGN